MLTKDLFNEFIEICNKALQVMGYGDVILEFSHEKGLDLEIYYTITHENAFVKIDKHGRVYNHGHKKGILYHLLEITMFKFREKMVEVQDWPDWKKKIVKAVFKKFPKAYVRTQLSSIHQIQEYDKNTCLILVRQTCDYDRETVLIFPPENNLFPEPSDLSEQKIDNLLRFFIEDYIEKHNENNN